MTKERLEELFNEAKKVEFTLMTNDLAYYKEHGSFTYYLTKEGKQLREQLKKARREVYLAYEEYEKENHLVWEEEKWITDFGVNGYTSMDEARTDLLNHLSEKPGVKVISDAKGIKFIEVKTLTKIYNYSIHAFYNGEWLEDKNGKFIKNCFGACLYKNEYNYNRNKWQELLDIFGEEVK